MSETAPLIRSVSDTARWVAVYRAQESERPDALFRDPFAQRLAGSLGKQIHSTMPYQGRDSWPFVVRTYLFDQFILGHIQQGVDLVVNLGAGLDARPYRMALAPSLKWIEVDHPQIIDYKEEVLAGEKPACTLERVRLDLANVDARRELFAHAGTQGSTALIVTEGVLIYLEQGEVGALARDLSSIRNFKRWVMDISSPGLVRMIQKQMPQLGQAGSPLKFGPAEGPEFFAPYGWKTMEVRSMFKAAARAKRLSWWMRLLALLPESQGAQGARPWSGVCTFTKPV